MSFDVADILAPGGAIARRLDGYESRPEQLRMAKAVDETLGSRGRLLIEAGTGVGKSFAYLVPAIRQIIAHSKRVIVATNTISLQEQLIEKDLPLLNAVIPEEFTSVLVKGRGNYLSIRRLELAGKREARLLPDEPSRRSLHQIEDWAYTTTDGSLATLPQLDRPEVWDLARSDAHNCMGRKCPTYDKCFFQAARRRMENADLLVCNHSIFFADLALRSQGAGLLPPYDHVILDEAHGIEDVAADHFGLTLTESRIRHLLGLLYRPRTGSGFLVTLPTGSDEHTQVERTIQQVLACSDATDRLFDNIQMWRETSRNTTGEMAEPGVVDNPLSEPMEKLGRMLALLKQKMSREEDEFELASYAQRAADIGRETKLLLQQEIEDCVYWVEETGSRRRGFSRIRLGLRCAPIEVGPILREQLFGRDVGIVLTSATLATSADDFTHTRLRLGCDDAEAIQLGSPFDHASQLELFVERNMPDPRDDRFVDSLCARIMHHVEATDGGAFVLFTSFSMLNEAADRMAPVFEQAGFHLLVHRRDGSRSQLIERFRELEDAVLFGTMSFWQGVDVRGRALRNVMITRLPFEVPDRPLVRARMRRIEEQGGSPFMQDSVPRAVIRFKQGFGRLIRSSSDRGRVVVLDPRIVTKAYGRMFLQSFPSGVREAEQEEDEWVWPTDAPATDLL